MPRVPNEAAVLRDLIYAGIRRSLPDGVSAKRFRGWGPLGREFYIEFAYGREVESCCGDLCFTVGEDQLWLIRQDRFRPNWKTTYAMGIGGRYAFERGYSIEGIVRKLLRAARLLVRAQAAEDGSAEQE